MSTVEKLLVLQLWLWQQIGPCLSKYMNPESLRALRLKIEWNQPHNKKRKFIAIYLYNEHLFIIVELKQKTNHGQPHGLSPSRSLKYREASRPTLLPAKALWRSLICIIPFMIWRKLYMFARLEKIVSVFHNCISGNYRMHRICSIYIC